MLKSSDRIVQARPVADWVAVHGNAVISDACRPVNISHDPGEAIITAKVGTDHWSTGVVHFVLPSAPNGSVKPMKLLINFETTMARPYKVEIHYGGSEVFQLNLSEDDTLECLDISSIIPFGVQKGTCRQGVNVSITIEFRHTNSKISFESVGMVFSK